MSLTKESIKTLKRLGNGLEAKYQIGKAELGKTQLDLLDKALTAHELIKVSILQNSSTEAKQAGAILEKELGCAVVSSIGRTLLLYRYSEKRKDHLV